MKHASHPAIIKRLKRASGHLISAIGMMETGRPCAELAQQLHAIERAIANAKRELIHDHINHCLEDHNGAGKSKHKTTSFAELKALTKYL